MQKLCLLHPSVWIGLLLLGCSCHGFNHRSCNRATRSQFQFDDCYLPPMDRSLLLSEASFLMSHNAATGYIKPGSLSKRGLSWFYSKNQVGSAYQQLEDGARALDLRPKLLQNETVIFQHGEINIPVALQDLLGDVLRWCKDNPDELVLLFSSHFAYESPYVANLVELQSAIYQNMGVNYLECGDVYAWTVGDAMDAAALPSNGGYLLALDGQDYYGSFCGKDNWIDGELVTCYPSDNISCKKSPEPFAALQEYLLQSANNPSSDSSSSLGPPESLDVYPFNEIQALWQVDAQSVRIGLSHLSSLLDDNRQSKINEKMVSMIYQGQFKAISLFAVDNVHLNGNALLSVLRNTCGQSQESKCGTQLPMPAMRYFQMTTKRWIGVVSMVYLCFLIFSIVRYKRPKLLYTLAARLSEKLHSPSKDKNAAAYDYDRNES